MVTQGASYRTTLLVKLYDTSDSINIFDISFNAAVGVYLRPMAHTMELKFLCILLTPLQLRCYHTDCMYVAILFASLLVLVSFFLESVNYLVLF